MAATDSKKKTGDVQHSLFGGEVRRRRSKNDVRNPPSNGEDKKGQNEAVEPPRAIPNYASSPIVHLMYVDKNLRSVVLTGRKLGMPPDTTQIVFDEDGSDAQPKLCTRLTPELFREIMDQLNATSAAELGAERAKVIGDRWERIHAWARAEGWTTHNASS